MASAEAGIEAQDKDRLAEDLRAAVGRFVRHIRSEASTPTTSQTETLNHLARQGPLTTAALAKLRGVKHQSMRLVVAELAHGGLVTLVPDPEDARAKTIQLTQQGRDAVSSARNARADTIACLLRERLSQEERDCLVQAVRILGKLAS